MEKHTHSGAISIGPAGWSYRDWIGPVYPAAGKVDELRFIARYFDCIELNSSFYRTPSPRLVRSWADRTADKAGFTFTIKVLQRFTHERSGDADEAKRFIHTFDPLLERAAVGAFLLQFPWSFRNDAAGRDAIEHLGDWFRDLPVAIELRHGSWNRAETFSLLADRGLSFCNIDQPVIGDAIAPTEIVTDPKLGYIRLHGRNRKDWARKDAGRDERYDYLYDENELKEWKERAERVASKTASLYIITNNHFRAQALVNAFQLRHLLSGQMQDMPQSLVASYPVLRDIARVPPSQGMLL